MELFNITSTLVSTTTTTTTKLTKPPTISATTLTTTTKSTTIETTTPTTVKATTDILQNFTDISTNSTLPAAATKATATNESIYLILAIVLSVVFCIAIILIVCFVTYRRGLKSRKRAQEAAQKAFQARVTPKNARLEELKYDGHSFSQSGSRYSGKIQSSPDKSINEVSAGKSEEKGNFVEVRPQNEYVRPGEHKTNGAVDNKNDKNSSKVTNGEMTSEPQYMNFAVVHSDPDDNGALYIDLANENQSGPRSPDNVQSPTTKFPLAVKTSQSGSVKTEVSQSETANIETGRESAYENLQSPGPDGYEDVKNKDPIQEAIYQNTMQQNQEDVYVEASKTDDIYVDMA